MNINYFFCRSSKDCKAVDVCSWGNCLLAGSPPTVCNQISKNYTTGFKEKRGGPDPHFQPGLATAFTHSKVYTTTKCRCTANADSMV